MKLTFLFIVVSFFQLQAFTFYGQNAKVSFNMDDASLEMVIKSIEGQTDYNFFYNIEDIDTRRSFTLKVDKRPLRVVLKTLFKNTPIDYEVVDKQIVLTVKKEGTSIRVPTETTQHRVKGIVIDSNGVPIAGATVTIKGTSIGTFTNEEGVFFVNASPPDVLVLTYIGFKPFEIQVGNSDELSIVLQEDITNLDAVTVNAGYYTVKERERTGNISKVTAEEIELQPVISPLSALNGRVAGLEITPSAINGNPGAAPAVRIRGQNSLRDEGNYPLYIIDGVPVSSTPVESVTVVLNMDPLNFLNPSNIESIEILKDADATAIYGSRGANGVILITTKKGLNQKTTLRTRIYSGLSAVPNRLDLLNTQEYLAIRNRAFKNDGIVPTEANAYDIILWDSDRNVDWQDLIFGGTAEITDVNISLSGGNDNTSFRIGSSYRNQGTVYMGDYDYNKITFGLNLIHTSDNKKFKANLSVNYGVDVNNLIGYLNLTSQAFSLPPNAPTLFNNEGSLNFEDWGNVVGINNPLQGYFNTSETRTTSLVSNFNLAYKIFHGLEFKTNLGYNTYDNDEIIKRPQKSYADLDRGNSSVHRQIDRISWLIEPQLIFDVELGEGALNAIAGITFQYSENKLLSLLGDGYVAQNLIGNLNAAENVTVSSNNTLEYKYAAIFGRLGYQWSHKYFINLTGRRDGSSRFGPGKRFSNFGAVGAAWIFSEENYFKNKLSLLSFGKLRGSYGITGNDQIPDYGYLDAYEPTQKADGLYPVQLFNPNYSWEINKKLEVAIELGLIQNKINVGLSWYRNRSSNQLVGYVLPDMTGFSEVQANLPATVQNTGWELELVTRNIQSKNSNWTTSFNISFPKNKLLNYPNIEQSSYANRYRVGHPLDVRLLYNYIGLDPETGYYSVEDFNEDGRLNFEDRQIIGDLGRKFYGGINNIVNYKNFSLQFLLVFAKQKGILDQFNAGALENQRNVSLQALEEETPFQKISQTSQANLAYSNAISSPFSLVDGSFLRLKNFVIGYKLPKNVLDTIGVSDVNIFLSGQNLFTITGYKGMDPETPRQFTSFSGLRTITCGLQLNF